MMTITKHINEIFQVGNSKFKITYKLYTPTIPSGRYLIIFHGKGERSVDSKGVAVTDGSLLDRVEAHGYPNAAKNGYNFQFNIVAVQCTTGYGPYKKLILPWASSKFGINFILTGYSLGAMFVYDLLTQPYAKNITAFFPVCGKGNVTTVGDCVDRPSQAWHGNKDMTVKYNDDVTFINAYNATHANKIELITLDGVGHDAWNKAYSVVKGEDMLLERINTEFVLSKLT